MGSQAAAARAASGQEATSPDAIRFILLSTIIFACLDTSAKYLVTTGFAPVFVTWCRFAVHAILACLIVRPWQYPERLRMQNVPLHLARGVFLSLSTVLNFFALQTLQLAETSAISFFGPILMIALAGPLLGEWVGWRRWVAVLVGFLGVLIITRPGLGDFAIGYVYAIVGIVCATFYGLLTRKLSATETPESLMFYPALIASVVLLPAVPFYGAVPTDPISILLLLVVGAAGGGGHWFVVLAYRKATASALAPYPYLQMVWMIITGYLVFAQLPDMWTLVGAAVVIASGLYAIHRERVLRLEETAASAAAVLDKVS